MSILIGFVLAAFGGSVASAQEPSAIKVKVPFAFNIGEKSMDQGDYVVVLARATKTIVFRPAGAKTGSAGEVSAEILTHLGSASPSSTLVFDRNKDGNVLSEVWFTSRDGYLVKGQASDLFHEHRLVKGVAAATK